MRATNFPCNSSYYQYRRGKVRRVVVLAMANHSHRAGRLKQQNKKNKRSAASKRSLGRRAGAGKVAGTTAASGGKGSSSKLGGVVSAADGRANRLNSAKQRKTKQVDGHCQFANSTGNPIVHVVTSTTTSCEY